MCVIIKVADVDIEDNEYGGKGEMDES